MEYPGRVHNGVVVLDQGSTLPEGTRVAVVPFGSEKPWIECMPGKLPLVHGGEPESIELTSQRIAEILDDEEAKTALRQWNVPA